MGKLRYLVFLCGFMTLSACAPGQSSNLALQLDGENNDVRTGIGIIGPEWTLESWFKSQDREDTAVATLIGGGEYSELKGVDNLPLVIEKGRVHNRSADLWSPPVLDGRWHHVALSCDGAMTRMYLDGAAVDSSRRAAAVIPGALGVQDNDSTLFRGWIDEVRIWQAHLSAGDLNAWRSKPLAPSHPAFDRLIAYYNFDDGITEAGINWVGMGVQPYHLRNGRFDYTKSTRLAIAVASDNPYFDQGKGGQSVFNAVVIPSEWDMDQGAKGVQVLKLRVAVSGSSDALPIDHIDLDLSGVTRLRDIRRLELYYTGNKARSELRERLAGAEGAPGRSVHLEFEKGAFYLRPGINYFLLTADLTGDAIEGDRITITLPSVRIGDRSFATRSAAHAVVSTVTASSQTDPNTVKVLQWNIWHGGRHLGDSGRARITDLIKASGADVMTMQESYGAQRGVARTLGFHLVTPSDNDNLAVFSRYPLKSIPSNYNKFYSNLAVVSLPNGRELLVDGCWLRYGVDPEYTSVYPDQGQDTDAWIRADSVTGLVDIRGIVEKDVNAYDPELPVVVAGDFNSCSHLDWTDRAAGLHYGYGRVAFPSSGYMLGQGFKDSFREQHPDEVTRGEGTWAVIYGHSQHCRIDFIYYRGSNIFTKASKIIRTTPEIDDVWPSDHAAVLTVFELTDPNN